MVALVDLVRDAIDVDHHQFLIASLMTGYADPPGWRDWDQVAAQADREQWFIATANRGLVISTFGSHHASAMLELWDGSPPDDTSDWERNRVENFYSSSGFACVDGIYGRGSYTYLDLRHEHREWHVRGSGRAGTTPQYLEDSLPSGLEEWRFQFWPAFQAEPELRHLPRRPLP